MTELTGKDIECFQWEVHVNELQVLTESAKELEKFA